MTKARVEFEASTVPFIRRQIVEEITGEVGMTRSSTEEGALSRLRALGIYCTHHGEPPHEFRVRINSQSLRGPEGQGDVTITGVEARDTRKTRGSGEKLYPLQSGDKLVIKRTKWQNDLDISIEHLE